MDYALVLALIATWLAILTVCWLGWQLLRQNGRILLRLEALEKRSETGRNGQSELAMLPIGFPAPHFELPDLSGKPKSLADFVGQPVLLIFFNPECGFCRDLVPKLAALETECRRSLSAAATNTEVNLELLDRAVPSGSQPTATVRAPLVLILTTGEAGANRQLLDTHKLTSPVLLQNESDVAALYRANGTPTGYLIDAAGKIASELAIGGEALMQLAAGKPAIRNLKSDTEGKVADDSDGRENRFRERSVSRSKLNRDGLKAGTPAPDFRLPLLGGGELSLTELRGHPVFLVFSSPHCDPCNTLAPVLEKFHRKHRGLKVVMISRGEPGESQEKVKEHGLTFPVVLQKQWEISLRYAIFASPVAYLIDREGVIAADVAVGVEPIIELMARAGPLLRQPNAIAKAPLLKRMAHWPVSATAATLDWLSTQGGVVKSGIESYELKHFKFVPRADDIFIVTYPRSGTTWMQMILYQLTTDGSMDISHIAEHSPWFERSAGSESGYEGRAAPRVFKSHHSYRGIPKGPGRYIYVARDGRDVAVSYYHLYRSHRGYKGTLSDFFELFMSGKVMHGSWFEHVGGWWKRRHKLNVLFLTYEELVADLEGCVRRIIAFCHLPVSPERMPVILERCSFAFMKQHENKFDPAAEALRQEVVPLKMFVRAGRVGEGVRRLDQQQQARFDDALQARSGTVPTLWLVPNALSQQIP